MQINAIKQTEGGYVVNESIFVPEDLGNSDCKKIQEWIISGGTVSPEFTNEDLLVDAKAKKRQEIKTLRDEANIKPFLGQTAYILEKDQSNNWIKTNTAINFTFSTAPTGQPLTEPANILFSTMIGFNFNTDYFTPYSTYTVENGITTGEQITVCLDATSAIAIQLHLAHRSSKWVEKANQLESQVSNAQTIEGVNSIMVEYV